MRRPGLVLAASVCALMAAASEARAQAPEPRTQQATAVPGSKHIQGRPTVYAPDANLLIAERGSELRGVVERYTADRGVLQRRYPQQYSPAQREVFGKFYEEWLGQLKAIDLDKLSHGAKADHVLLRNSIEEAQDLLRRDTKVYADLGALLGCWMAPSRNR